MVLLAMSLLLSCIPTPTSSAVTNIVVLSTAPLTIYASWDDDIDPPQTYKVTLRDIPARASYVVNGVTAKEFLFDAAGQAQLFWETTPPTPLVIQRSQTYMLQVKGETDLAYTSYTVGYIGDTCGPPSGPVICDVTDETSANPPVSLIPPSGCQREQVPGKVRLYYSKPVDYGYAVNEDNIIIILGYVFQWSLDATFTTNVFEETCMDASPVPPTIEDGAVCTFQWKIAQIPPAGSTMYEGLYFIRMAVVYRFDVGPFVVGLFTEAVSVRSGLGVAPTPTPIFPSEWLAEGCYT